MTPWTAAHQASLSITNFRSLPRLMFIESVMPSSHLILCRPLLLLGSIFPSIRVFSSESVLYIRWPKCFSFSISPSNEHSGLISFSMDMCTFCQFLLLNMKKSDQLYLPTESIHFSPSSLRPPLHKSTLSKKQQQHSFGCTNS